MHPSIHPSSYMYINIYIYINIRVPLKHVLLDGFAGCSRWLSWSLQGHLISCHGVCSRRGDVFLHLWNYEEGPALSSRMSSFSLVGDVDWSWPNQNVQDQESSEISVCVQAYVYVYKDWLPQSLTTWKFIFWQTHGFGTGIINLVLFRAFRCTRSKVMKTMSGDKAIASSKGAVFWPVARWREIMQRQHGWMLHGADFRHVSKQLKRVMRS